MDSVTRLQVVQSFLNLFNNPRYLEVGVWKGKTFGPITAFTKVAVDPTFPDGVKERLRAQPNAEIHEITSDQFFAQAPVDRKFDVIYLDGLHTFEQTLRDLINAVSFIAQPGIIIVDDVYPDTYHGSLANVRHSHLVKRATESESKNWMGDVYKLTLFIDTFFQQYSYRMVSDNHGQLVIWPKRRPSVTERSVESIARASFEALFIEAEAQRRTPLADIIKEVSGDLNGPRTA